MKFIRVMLITVLLIKLFSTVKAYAIETMLKVAFEPNLPPYQFEENGKYVGAHIDILNSIANKNNFIIEYIPMQSDTECMKALDFGEVDIVLGAIKNNSYEFETHATDSISQSSIIMVALNEVADKIRYRTNRESISAVLENGTISYSYIQKMENLRYIVVSNQLRAFDMLVSKEADVLVGVKSSILYQLEKANIEDDYTIVGNYMVPIEYTMLTKAGDRELRMKLNNELQRLRINGEYEKIHEKWINEEKHSIKEILNAVLITALILVVISLLIFLFNFRLNLLLKKQVGEKTKELQKINVDLQNQIIETRNNNELKNCIVEHNPSGIIAFDTNYKITLFNQSACYLTKLRHFPIGQSVFDIPVINNILINTADKLFNENLILVNKEMTIKHENNINVSYRYDIYQLYNFDNSIRGAIITIDDVTKELRIKEQVFEKEKNAALNRIIAGIAHEIRNPLTSIKTFVQLIPTKIDNQNFQNLLAEFVPKEVDRVNNLIKNLIDYAKPETSNKHKVNINEIVKSCTMLINPTLENRNIKLTVLNEEDLIIIADKNQLKQIIINVILNGLDSMNEKIENSNIKYKLHIDIKLWGDDENAFIQITDEGLGMTEEEIKKSTEPFYTNKANGTGLGLSISKQYIEENNGTMIIESEPFLYTRITMRFRRCLNEYKYFDYR